MNFKFIKLTEKLNRGETKALLLNVAYISHVQAGLNGSDTHIRMCTGNGNATDRATYYFVKESFEEVWNMINGNGEYIAPLNGA